jgi:uncharacterized YccA/Bax inhibitor family protein
MRSGNPVLKSDTFDTVEGGERMTINGTINKTAILLSLCLITAIYTWGLFYTTKDPATVMPYVWVGGIGGFALAILTVTKLAWVAITAPIYALVQGLLVGAVSAMFEVKYPGIVLQAVFLTFGTMACMLVAYRTGLIKATENFKLGVVAATGGIFLLYIVSFVLSFFGIHIGFIHEGGTFGILFSVFVVVIAALNLVLDFDFIREGVEQGAPKKMEWYGAFALTVTLVWLYLEILRLLGKIRK